MDTEPPIDSMEKNIRLGCGAVFGIGVGLLTGVIALGLTAGLSWFVAIVSGAICAFLALRFGNRFWGWAAELIRFPFS
jgi:hypothetical protein